MIHDDLLGFHGVAHVEGGLFNEGEDCNIGMLIAEGLEGSGHVFDDMLALVDIGLGNDGDIGDGEDAVVIRHLHHGDLGEQLILAEKTVFLVENGQQEVAGLGVAAHEDIGLSLSDEVNRLLDDLVVVPLLHDLVVTGQKAEVFEHFGDLVGIADEDGISKTRGLRPESAQENVFGVGTGNDYAEGLFDRACLVHNKVKVLFIHCFHSNTL